MRHALLACLLPLGACGGPPPAGYRMGAPPPVKMLPASGSPVPQVWECADSHADPTVPVMKSGSTGLSCEQGCAPHYTAKYLCTDIEDFVELPKIYNSDGSEQILKFVKTAETIADAQTCPGSHRIYEVQTEPKFFTFLVADVDFKGLQIAQGSDCSKSGVTYNYVKDHPNVARTRWYTVAARLIPELGR